MKNTIRNMKEILSSVLWNWRILLLFELIYKMLGGVVIFPLLNNLINFTIKKAKLEYLDMEMISKWISSPFTIPILIICFFILGIYVVLEITVLVQYFYSARKEEDIYIKTLVSKVAQKLFYIISPRNWLIFVFVIILFPITMFAIAPDALVNLRVPEYILDFIKGQGNLYIIYIILSVSINILVFYTIYSIPIFILEDVPFIETCKRSYLMMKKKFFKTLLRYVLWIISILLIFSLIVGVFLLFNIIQFRYIKFEPTEFLFNYIQFKQFIVLILKSTIFIGSFAFIMNSYFNLIDKESEIITVNKRKAKNKPMIIFISIIEILLVFFAIGIYIDYQGNVFYKYTIMNKEQDIVAHRAGSVFAPENTLLALDIAIKANAEYAEIDVQQSKDRKLIILHDTNFKRVAGVDKNVWDVNYDEIKTYNAANYYSSELNKVKIPTLEEMIKRADGKIKLMIELKKNGHEYNIEEETINLIKKYNFENQCVVASMELNILHKVKELDKNIKTVYITPLAYGDYYEMDDVDMFSIEATFVNKEIIFKIHNQNKKVFAWTVNEDSSIRELLSLPIDGIITDNPELAKYYKIQGVRDIFISDLMEIVFSK